MIKKLKYPALLIVIILSLSYFLLPSELFEKDKSKIIYSREGNLLSARITSDKQWRFPESDINSEKIKQSILHFEDEYFYYHFGINPVSVLKAFYSNIKHQKKVRGASTISMQTIRLALSNPERTYFEKIKESILVLGLELKYSKKEILNFYLNNAPFGGNVVGINAASWRYFNRSADNLSWAEAATLAVLPNAPSLIHPGRNRDKLTKKRNKLLLKLYNNRIIDKESYDLALLEQIPNKPYPLPDYAAHLVNISNPNTRSTINYSLQKKILSISKTHMDELYQNQIFNNAILVIDLENLEILAYMGNAYDKNSRYSNYVDIIRSPRSTGSILKPVLYGALYDSGILAPNELIPDIPTYYNGFTPENYTKKYEGAVRAGNCLSRSLNIPAVRILQDYGLERFYDVLQKYQLTNINRGPNSYGLSLILGGAEESLWNLSRMYANIAANQLAYEQDRVKYKDFIELKHYVNQDDKVLSNEKVISRGAFYTVYEQLKSSVRPQSEEGWKAFENYNDISWKTGTSNGFKDAWSIGWNSKYLVGVWVGNANGEGRPGILGIKAAAPIMFDVFSDLKSTSDFLIPHDELVELKQCRESGLIKGDYCINIDTILAPISEKAIKQCNFHKEIFTDKSKRFRVSSDCYPVTEMKSDIYFVLPPVQSLFYKKYHSNYKELPPWKEDCKNTDQISLKWIYPGNNSELFIPRTEEGEKSELIFEIAHKEANSVVFWHLDGNFIARTENIHNLSFNCPVGKHIMTCIDSDGNSISKSFNIKN